MQFFCFGFSLLSLVRQSTVMSMLYILKTDILLELLPDLLIFSDRPLTLWAFSSIFLDYLLMKLCGFPFVKSEFVEFLLNYKFE